MLGPILFLIFINDLPIEVISPLSLSADDSIVFTRIVAEKNIKNQVQPASTGNEVLI